MGKFRKKPIVIEARQFTKASEESLWEWLGDAYIANEAPSTVLHIGTLEGVVCASEGDWIIRGIAGEFYPCKPGIFAATYEPGPLPDDDFPKSLSEAKRIVAQLRSRLAGTSDALRLAQVTLKGIVQRKDDAKYCEEMSQLALDSIADILTVIAPSDGPFEHNSGDKAERS